MPVGSFVRIFKLLIYLDEHFPGEGWNAYYTKNAVLWHKIIVLGHSQGGGHAGLLGKYYRVRKVIMYSALDWNAALNQPATWYKKMGATSLSRYYAVNSVYDELMAYHLVKLVWRFMGLIANEADITGFSGVPEALYVGHAMAYCRKHTCNGHVNNPNHVALLHNKCNGNADVSMVSQYMTVWRRIIQES